VVSNGLWGINDVNNVFVFSVFLVIVPGMFSPHGSRPEPESRKDGTCSNISLASEEVILTIKLKENFKFARF
jgi:hypothetical protein